MNREERKKKFEQIDIYPATCEALSNGKSDIEVLYNVIKGGAKIIQLREKEYPYKKFLTVAKKFREITAKHDILLIINDSVDIALKVGADGVHLGQHDMPIIHARELAPELLIGASTHNIEEAIKAEKDGADYINIGPIFATGTKPSDKPLGIKAIRSISSKVSLPFTVMGGINMKNIDQVLKEGARKIAVVTAITQAENIEKATRTLKNRISGKGNCYVKSNL